MTHLSTPHKFLFISILNEQQLIFMLGNIFFSFFKNLIFKKLYYKISIKHLETAECCNIRIIKNPSHTLIFYLNISDTLLPLIYRHIFKLSS